MENELKCKHCGRHLGKSYGTVVAEIKCPNSACRGTTQFHIIQADNTKDIVHKFTTPETPPKTKDSTVKKKVEVS